MSLRVDLDDDQAHAASLAHRLDECRAAAEPLSRRVTPRPVSGHLDDGLSTTAPSARAGRRFSITPTSPSAAAAIATTGARTGSLAAQGQVVLS